MKVKKLFFHISIILLGIIITFILVYSSLPLYPWTEFFSKEKNFFIKSSYVEEDLKGLTYYKGRIYFNNINIGNFSIIGFYRFPLPNFLWTCKTGLLQIKFIFNKINVAFNKFSCASLAQGVNGHLKIFKEKIYGNLFIKTLRIPTSPFGVLKNIKLNFKGNEFSTVFQISNQTVVGKGNIYINLLNFSQSKINALFNGENIKFHIKGTLENFKVFW